MTLSHFTTQQHHLRLCIYAVALRQHRYIGPQVLIERQSTQTFMSGEAKTQHLAAQNCSNAYVPPTEN